MRPIAYISKTSYYFNKKVRPHSIKIEDLVLLEVRTSSKRQEERKVGPKWQGLHLSEASNRIYSYHL